MKVHVTTNILVDSKDYESFKLLVVKRQVKKGAAIGDLISAEVKRCAKLIKGE